MTEKTFYIENLGCAKNQVDAETIIASLSARGWQYMDTPDKATVIIINTCGFIEAAKTESLNVTLQMRAAYPDKRIIMAGCLAQRYKSELEKDLEEVDAFAGNREPGEVFRLLEPSAPIPEIETLHTGRRLLSGPGSGYIKIAEGCNNHCTFCSIPLIRGPLRSRPVAGIVNEVQSLLAGGIFEFNLIAQDLAAFGSDRKEKEDILKLFRQLTGLEGHFWIRPLYIHPDKFPFELLEIMRGDNRFLPYFDLPFQHASGKILKQMNRRGNGAIYLDLIQRIRDALPGAVIRSTLLTGFPGESRQDFGELLEFQQAARLDWLGVFTYSREEDTPAWSFKGRVKPDVAVKRKKELEKRQEEITTTNLTRFKGKILDVLIEEQVQEEELMLGRCYAQAPEVDGLTVVHASGLPPGQVVSCRIMKINGFDLEALPVSPDQNQAF